MEQVGILMTRNEEDVIREVLEEYKKQGFTRIYAVDSSDDKTLDIIREFGDIVVWSIKDVDVGLSPYTIRDGARHYAYEKIVSDLGHGFWVFLLQGDEIYHNSVCRCVEQTDESKCNILNTLVADFVIHKIEMETVLQEDVQTSVQKRRLWYYVHWQENCAFYNTKNLRFDVNQHMKVIPKGLAPLSSPYILFRKHYNCRSVEQLQKRIKDRVDRGWQLDYSTLKPFVSSIADIIPEEKLQMIYSDINRFDGYFYIRHPQFEQFVDVVVDGHKFLKSQET